MMAAAMDEKEFDMLLDEIDSEQKEVPLFDMVPKEFAEFVISTSKQKVNDTECDAETWNKLKKLLIGQKMTAYKLLNSGSNTWTAEWRKECNFNLLVGIQITIPLIKLMAEERNILIEKLRETDIDFFQNELKKYRTIPLWLLEICAKEGFFRMAEFLCDVGVKSNDNLIELARNSGNHAVCSLLLFRRTGANLGEKVSTTINKIDSMNGICEYAVKNMSEQHMNQNIEFMIKCIESQSPISEELLSITMTYLRNQYMDDPTKILHCKLFETIIAEFEKIITDTSNKIGFAWINMFIIPSSIWYWDHPDPELKKQKKLLYHELLIRIKKETKIQAKKWLQDEIEKLKKQNNSKLWRDLVEFGDNLTQNMNVRQDALKNGLKSSYSIFDLIAKKQVGGWNPVEHYNCNIFLNQLLMNANDIDDIFQQEMKKITNIIQNKDEALMRDSSFHRGPIKRAERSRVKVQSDYFDEAFPSSSKLLDINRCSLYFTNGESMYRFLIQFTEYINSNKSNVVTDIARIKNGFKEFDDDDNKDNYFYADIKINVVLKNQLIAEIQFLLSFMSEFKNSVSHSLYSIQRHEEFVSNFSKIKYQLLDETTQLFTNASFGNYKLILNHIVSHNKNIQQYLFKTDTNNFNIFQVAILSNQAMFIKKLWNHIVPKNEIKKFIDGQLIYNAVKKQCAKSLILILSEWQDMVYSECKDKNNSIIHALVVNKKCHIVLTTIFKKLQDKEKIKILLFMNENKTPSFHYGLQYEDIQNMIMDSFKNQDSKTICNAFTMIDKYGNNGFIQMWKKQNTMNIFKWLESKLSKFDMNALYKSIRSADLVEICQTGKNIDYLLYFVSYLETNDGLTNNEKLKCFIMNDEGIWYASPLMVAMEYKQKQCVKIMMDYMLKNHPKSKTDIVFKMKKWKDHNKKNVFSKKEYGGDEMQSYLQSFIEQFVVPPKKTWTIDS